MENKTIAVVGLLSELILDNLNATSNEQYSPRFDADKMDQEIEFHQRRAEKLRAIRAEFENVMTGVLLP